MINLTDYKKPVFKYALVLAVVAFLFVARSASAVNYQVDQSSNASSIYSTLSDAPVVQTFYPKKNNIAGVLSYVVMSTTTTDIAYFLCRGVPDIVNINTKYNCGGDGNLLIAQGFVSSTTPGLSKDIFFYDPVGTWPNFGNYQYYYVFKPDKPAKFIFNGQQTSWSDTRQRGYGLGIPINHSMYFFEFYDADLMKKLFLIKPLNGVYNNEILNSFDLAINVDETFLFSNWTIRVNYGSTTAFGYSDKLTKKFDASGWQEIGIPRSTDLANGQYYWKATAYIASDDYGLAWGTSTIETFDINNLAQLSELSEFEKPTEAEICAGVDTGSFFGAIECALKKVAVWAFYPNAGTLKSVQDKTNSLKADFPFNTLFDLTTIANQAIASSTFSETGSFGIPFIKQTSTGTAFYILPIASSSTMPAFIGQDNTALFRNSIVWLAYLFLAGIIYLQVRIK